MSVPQVLLDTDILSALMRQDPAVTAKAQAYLADHQRFTLSINANLYKLGELVGDADILIAATALVNGFGVSDVLRVFT